LILTLPDGYGIRIDITLKRVSWIGVNVNAKLTPLLLAIEMSWWWPGESGLSASGKEN
jgi:hypothetical protein